MKKVSIANMGKVELEGIEVINGQLEVHIPVEIERNSKVDLFIDECMKHYKEIYPTIDTMEDVYFDFMLIVSFGYANPEFEFQIYICQKSDNKNKDTSELFDGFNISLSESDTKMIKKIIWNKLGETFLGF
ncbi:MAG: hypothetical protein PHW34_07690 [Hespellia sp.]|nr:hypothetical protein [Hespellia sp.]